MKDKNIAELGGRPLLNWAITAAKDSGAIDQAYVSTDSELYADIAKQSGAEVIYRPPELCTDDSTSEDGIAHALKHIQFNTGALPTIACLLQPTSPLTRPETIRKVVNAIRDNECDTALSVVKARKKPQWTLKLTEKGLAEPFITLPKNSPYLSERPPDNLCYPTGGVYAFKVDYFNNAKKIYGGQMYPVIVSALEGIDIDDETDLNYARFALQVMKESVKEKQVEAHGYAV